MHQGATGSILAAIGTALPETIIPIIAVGLAAGRGEQSQEYRNVAFGAIAGAPFMLSTLAMLVTGILGWAFERIIIRPVYGLHLKQILITMGGMIVAEQLIHVIWGAEQIPLQLPATFRGAFIFGDAALEKYRYTSKS